MEINICWEDFNSICRFCLNQNILLNVLVRDNPTIGLDNQKTLDSKENLIDMILLCTGLDIKINDELPSSICDDCLHKLLASYSFRKRCISSEVILRQIKLIHDVNVSTASNSSSKYLIKKNSEILPKNSDDLNEYELPLLEQINKNDIQNDNISLKTEIINDTKLKRNKPKIPTKDKRRKTSKLRNEKRTFAQCQICGRMQRNMNMHMVVHSGEKKFECDICGKKFTVKSNLKFHFDVHLNTRNFPCPFCPHKFRQAAHLNRHILTHTGERHYPCDICDKSFRQSGTRDEHRRTHLQERKIKCEYCDKLFLNKKGLKNHVGIHTGVRPYKCYFCDMTFITSSSASVHRRRHLKLGKGYECTICKLTTRHLQLFKTHMKEHGVPVK